MPCSMKAGSAHHVPHDSQSTVPVTPTAARCDASLQCAGRVGSHAQTPQGCRIDEIAPRGYVDFFAREGGLRSGHDALHHQ